MTWEEKIRESDAGKAKPEEAEAIIARVRLGEGIKTEVITYPENKIGG